MAKLAYQYQGDARELFRLKDGLKPLLAGAAGGRQVGLVSYSD